MKKQERFPFELDLEGARKIIDVSCSDWRSKLINKWGILIDPNVFDIEVTQSFYKEMRDACDDKQNKVLDEVFGKDEESVKDILIKYFRDRNLMSETHEHFTNNSVLIKRNFAFNDAGLDELLETFNIEFKNK